MEYNIRRAIVRLFKKGKTPKETFEHINNSKEFGTVLYPDILKVREEYSHKKIRGKYKWCNICGCEHPHIYEIFGYNGFHKDGTRRLHSSCLKSRSQIKRNIIIMKDKRYEGIIKTNTKSRKKNKGKYKRKLINDLTPEEQEIRRATRRRDNFNQRHNGKKKSK